MSIFISIYLICIDFLLIIYDLISILYLRIIYSGDLLLLFIVAVVINYYLVFFYFFIVWYFFLDVSGVIMYIY